MSRSWVKNRWVLIRFTCTTGCSPKATVALSHRRQYIEDRQSEPIELLSVLSGDFQSFDEIFAEDNRIEAVLVARGVSSIEKQEFLKTRKVRNLLTHRSSAETDLRRISMKEAQTVFDYCLTAIRDMYPYNVMTR